MVVVVLGEGGVGGRGSRSGAEGGGWGSAAKAGNLKYYRLGGL